MAAPHATGVGALIVSQHGRPDSGSRGGLTLSPARTRSILLDSAAPHACPQPRTYSYPSALARSAYCAGPSGDNGFYGHGIVNALAAVG